MKSEQTVKQETADLEKRKELQAKLQEAIRRSAPSSEIRRIEAEIRDLNQRMEAAPSHLKKSH